MSFSRVLNSTFSKNLYLFDTADCVTQVQNMVLVAFRDACSSPTAVSWLIQSIYTDGANCRFGVFTYLSNMADSIYEVLCKVGLYFNPLDLPGSSTEEPWPKHDQHLFLGGASEREWKPKGRPEWVLRYFSLQEILRQPSLQLGGGILASTFAQKAQAANVSISIRIVSSYQIGTQEEENQGHPKFQQHIAAMPTPSSAHLDVPAPRK